MASTPAEVCQGRQRAPRLSGEQSKARHLQSCTSRGKCFHSTADGTHAHTCSNTHTGFDLAKSVNSEDATAWTSTRMLERFVWLLWLALKIL